MVVEIDCHLQGSEQKVSSLIVELDRLRCTVAEPSVTQIVDIVQRINEARTPEPSGSNSAYSALYVSHEFQLSMTTIRQDKTQCLQE